MERDHSNGEQESADGRPLAIGGTTYSKGIGAHAPSELSVYLGRHCTTFSAALGVDDETLQPGSVAFQVFGDDILLYDSGILRSGTPALLSTVDTTGIRMLSLRVTDGGDGRNFDHADWADAMLNCG